MDKPVATKVSKNVLYSNFEGNYSKVIPFVTIPETLQEMTRAVKWANKNNLKIKAVGGTHTWNSIPFTDGLQIQTHKLSKILEINTEKKTITAECGTTLRTLNRALALKGLALKVLPAIHHQTVAGSCATAVHGSDMANGTFASQAISYQIVLASGKLVTIDRNAPQQFAAVNTHLGALGIVYSVTLSCVPLFTMYSETIVVDSFSEYWKNRQLYHGPGKENTSVRIDPVSGKTSIAISGMKEQIDHHAVSRLYDALVWIGATLFLKIFWSILLVSLKLIPSLNTPVNHVAINSSLGDRTQVSFQMMGESPMSMEYSEEEIAVAVTDLPDAIAATLDHLKKLQKQNIYTLLTVNLRYVAADKESILSPTTDRDSVFISIWTKDLSKESEKLLSEWENIMITRFRGRPHWGKKHFLSPEKVKKIYGDKKINSFMRVRKQLDPRNVFQNDYLIQLFGS